MTLVTPALLEARTSEALKEEGRREGKSEKQIQVEISKSLESKKADYPQGKVCFSLLISGNNRESFNKKYWEGSLIDLGSSTRAELQIKISEYYLESVQQLTQVSTVPVGNTHYTTVNNSNIYSYSTTGTACTQKSMSIPKNFEVQMLDRTIKDASGYKLSWHIKNEEEYKKMRK